MGGVAEPGSPTPPTGHEHQSGHLMCYEGRTSSRALDSVRRSALRHLSRRWRLGAGWATLAWPSSAERPSEEPHGETDLHRARLLPGAPAAGPDRLHARRNAGVRTEHGARPRRGRGRGRRLHLHGRTQRRGDRRRAGPRDRRDHGRRGGGRDRAALAQGLVGLALRRARGGGGPTVLALSAFDMALWDLKARRAGLPLWNILGGYNPRVPVYAGGIDLDLPLDALLRQTDGNLAKGFRAIKMKVGRPNLSEDVERAKAMREHLGAGFPLMVDANMKWSVDGAIRAARALSPFDLTWLEEPTIPDDPAGHARIAREGGLPIAAGENLRSLWEFKLYIAGGGVSYPEPHGTHSGGVHPFTKIARLAEAFNLPVTSHGAHDVTVHLLAACPNR